MSSSARATVDWRLPLYGVAGAIVVLVPFLLSPAFDFAEIFFVFIGVPLALLILLILAVAKKSLGILLLAISVALTAWFLWVHADHIRFTGRWLLWGREYKAAARQQARPGAGLPHVEWDGWGFAGMDTVVYAVFDPSDSLAAAASQHRSGTVPGVPCGVADVYRLERNWYSVTMYTGTDWNDCASSDSKTPGDKLTR